MNSTTQMKNNNIKKSGPDKKENKVKGLYTTYNMNWTKQMSLKQADANLLDTNVPDINVPIMKMSERKSTKTNRFDSREWFQNAVRQTSLQIAD